MAVDKYMKFTKRWRWSSQPRPLSLWVKAPEEYGFYEIGYREGGSFAPKYGGRAAGATLRRRLRKHYLGSHNPHIRAARGRVWFRYKVFDSPAQARFVEALQVIAFEDEYEWNDRQEWAQHWALER